MDKSPNLTALVTSRICHDLASPLGAINNGLELLELSGISRTPEMALLQESIEAANARVQFFRIAYGSADPQDLMVPGMIQKVLSDYFAGKKTRATLTHLMPTPRPEVKLLLLLVQCLETALPYGGEIGLLQRQGSWNLMATGRVVMDNPVWQVFGLAAPLDDVPSSQIQFALAQVLAAELGHGIEITFGETQATIRLS